MNKKIIDTVSGYALGALFLMSFAYNCIQFNYYTQKTVAEEQIKHYTELVNQHDKHLSERLENYTMKDKESIIKEIQYNRNLKDTLWALRKVNEEIALWPFNK